MARALGLLFKTDYAVSMRAIEMKEKVVLQYLDFHQYMAGENLEA